MTFASVGALANVPQAHGLMQSMMHRGVGLGSMPLPAHNNNAMVQQRMFNAAHPGNPQVPPQAQALAQRAARGELSQAEAQQAMARMAPPGVAQRSMAQAAQAQGMGGMPGPFGAGVPYMGSRMQNPLNAMFGAPPPMQMQTRPGGDQMVGPMPGEPGGPPLGMFGGVGKIGPQGQSMESMLGAQAQNLGTPFAPPTPPQQAPIFNAAAPPRPKI
jgi:hypothetical protein